MEAFYPVSEEDAVGYSRPPDAMVDGGDTHRQAPFSTIRRKGWRVTL